MLEIIFYLILLQGVLLSVFILFKTKTNSHLGFFILFLTLITLNQYLSYHSIKMVVPSFNPLFGYALAPLLYFHLVSMLDHKRGRKIFRSHAILQIPIYLFILFWVFDDFRNKILGFEINSLIAPIIFIQFIVYAVLSIRLLVPKWRIINQTDSVYKKRIQWAIWIWMVFGFFMIQVICLYLFPNSALYEFFVKSAFLTILSLFIVMSAKSLMEPGFFISVSKGTDNSLRPMQKIYSDTKDNEVVRSLEKLMNNEETYRNPDLSLDMLARDIKVPTYYLSRIINTRYNHSYFDFINSYRLDEAKNLLSNAQEGRSIKEIMHGVGFNSKSSFNTAFKKHTGFTPSEFRVKFRK